MKGIDEAVDAAAPASATAAATLGSAASGGSVSAVPPGTMETQKQKTGQRSLAKHVIKSHEERGATELHISAAHAYCIRNSPEHNWLSSTSRSCPYPISANGLAACL